MANFQVTTYGRTVTVLADGEVIADNYANYLIVGVYVK
jgi:uncharacterized protein (DUF427 family)